MMTLIVQSWWEKLLLLFKQVIVDGKREYCLTNESDSEGQSVSETYLSQVLVQVHGNVIEVNCDGKLLSTKVYVNQNTFSTSRTCCVVCCVCTIGSLRRPLSKYCVLRVWEPVSWSETQGGSVSCVIHCYSVLKYIHTQTSHLRCCQLLCNRDRKLVSQRKLESSPFHST